MALFFSIVWLAIAIGLIARALRQNGAFRQLAPLAAPSACGAPYVAIVVAARDEAANIADCVSSLIAQIYPKSRLRIIVVDDHSSDQTAAVVSSLARINGNLTLIESPPLPAGWTGKTHACWIGSRTFGSAELEWLCFVDADVRAGPLLVATAVADATVRALDFFSLTPQQELHSFAERLIIPCGLYMLAFCQDLVHIQAPENADATATGQFILFRRMAYEQLGGHAAVAREICEDAALARLAKRHGMRVAIAGGDQLLRVRMYTGWRSLWLGVSKNLVDMLGGPASTALTAIGGAVLAWTCQALSPFFGLHLAGAAFFRIPIWYGLLFPLGYTVGGLMALDSVRRRLSGRTVWKGRVYS